MRRPAFLGRRQPPSLLRAAMAPPRDRPTREWMARNLVSQEEVEAQAWTAFQASVLLSCLGLIPMLAFAGLVASVCALVSALVLPFVISSYVSNRPARMARAESQAYLRHAPAALGSMAMSMSLSPSLEKAVLFAAGRGQDPLSRRLATASWEVMTRASDDVESSLNALASSLGQANQSLRQSLHLLVASTHEPTKEGMERLMDKASDITVQGLRQAAERYMSSLSTPVMVLFALGIMLPMMLLSMAPLLALSAPMPGQEPAAPQVPLGAMAFLLLVVAPVASILYCQSVLSAGPLSSMRWPELRPSAREALAWSALAVVMAGLVLTGLATRQPQAFLLLVAGSMALLLELHVRRRLPEPGRGPDQEYVIGLYQIGNRLSSGASLERALAEASATSEGTGFGGWASGVMQSSKLSRSTVGEAMAQEGGVRWGLLAEAYRTVARCAQGDSVAAGRVAVRLAGSLGDILECERGIQERSRGVVEMMRSTGSVFAPIVLGVTVGLFGLTSGLGGGAGPSGEVALIAGIYLMELSLEVAIFTTFLSGSGTWVEVARWMSRRMPLAVAVFTSVSLLSTWGFAR